MSHRKKDKKQAQTLAWITDDEAEFWTSITPNKKGKEKKYASDNDLPNGEHFQFPHVETNSIEIEQNQNQLNKIKEENNLKFYDNENSNSFNDPSMKFIKENHNFFSRLINELKGSNEIPFESESLSQPVTYDDYQQINTNDLYSNDEINEKNVNVFHQFSSFLDEITEESFVIIGDIDEETLLNRRSRKAKSFVHKN
ncbi:hypothetical protein I4U23_031292 [Adineta vaga]|nr:hypothetical protein I4U23_031292 [Adineta vaga]